jgi:hypothetical protein
VPMGMSPKNVLNRFVAVVLLVVLPAIAAFCQTPAPSGPAPWKFKFGGKVTEFNEKKQKDLALEGCIATISRGGVTIESQNTGKDGRFKFTMDPNGDYVITITKAGYITKRFAINTFNVPDERTNFPFNEFDVDIDLFKMFPGLDYSCLNSPIARIIYNPAPSIDDFDYDKVYTAQIQACIENLKRLAAEARAKQKLYQAAIDAADKLFAASDWSGAKAKYNEALGILANEQYPKDQIAKCDEKMGANAKVEADYKAAIDAANALFASKDYAGAKAKYQEASNIKPAEQYPKDRMKACDDALAAAGKEKQYTDAIAAADAKFAAKDYAGAKAKYQEASGMKPAEQYPKDRIKACDDAIAAAAKDKQYADAIADADAKFAAKDFAAAKAKYQEASNIKPSEQYPKDRMKACDDEIAKAGKDKAYADAIADADKKFAAKDFSGAKAKYQEASNLKPAEQYPKDRMKACDDEIAKAGKEKAYTDAIAEADKKFDAKDYAGAKAKYQEASNLKPAEQYPKDRMKACDDALAGAAKDKAYTDAIADADAKFAAKDFAAAKAKYQEAANLKPTEQYPKDRMKACDDELAKVANEKKYTDAIADADKKFAAKDFTGAKQKYQEASTLKPGEQYPKDQIKLCDAEIAKAGVDKQYNDLVKQADAKFTAKDYAGAKSLYEQASGLKSTEQYPKDKIKECDEQLALAAKNKQYTDLIKQADAKFAAKDWSGAKAIYQQASDVKPEEQYPKDRMKACDEGIAKAGVDQQYNDLVKQADTKFAAKDYQGAKEIYQQASGVKPTEQYPKDKIKACDDAIAKQGIDKQYTDLIASADAKFNAGDFAGAKEIYSQASALKTAEVYPKTQMKLCDEKISAAAKDSQYADLIKQADAKFTAKDWAGAKDLYKQASALKATEQYPKDRIKACDDELNKLAGEKKYTDAIADADAKFAAKDWSAAKQKYQEASTLKPGEQYPKDQIKLCDAEIAKIGADKQYESLVKQADTKFAAKDWAGAKALYGQASSVKPSEQYPKDKIKECDDQLAVAAKEKQYTDLIKQADAKFAAKDWSGAKAIYQQASDVKPEEQYPKDRMKACDEGIAKAGVDQQYNDLVKQADTKFAAKDYQGAKEIYQQASGVKPTEQYPKDKIKACDDAIAKQGVDKQYSDLIASADAKFNAGDFAGAKEIYSQASALKTAEVYPKTQMKACDDKLNSAAKNAQYTDLIKQADDKFAAKDWEGAKAIYQQASTLKATEQYPKDRIKACDAELSKLAGEKKYTDAIADADAKFAAKDWSAAKQKYQEASALKPGEQYPKDQIKLCDAEIAKIGADKQYESLVKQADAKFAAKDWAGAKALYGQASSVKPAEQYPKDQVILCDQNIGLAGIDKQYNDLVKQADAKFTLKAWADAKAIYAQASGVKPNEQYPKDRMKQCDDNIKAAADKGYNDVIAAADAKFKASDWAGAKTKYQEAQTMRPAETYPPAQIKICDEKIGAAGIDKQYNDLVKQADAKFTAKTWADAKTLYVQASGVKPNEQYPKDRIKLCDDELAAISAKDKQYTSMIARGDSAMNKKDYETAQSAFTQAKGMRPSEPYPQQKLDEISRLLSANEKDRAYNALLAKGDSLLKANNLVEAKKVFTSATVQRPADQYPKDKLAEIKRLEDQKKEDDAKNARYNKLVADADKKFNAKAYKDAKVLYQQALYEKPLEIYPKKQIQACDDALNPKPVNDDPRKKNPLAEQYPQGRTEKSSSEGGATITTVIVVVGDQGWEYTKKVYSWGTFYFKDGQQISEATFNFETSPGYVQKQQAEYDKTHKSN